jgi:uncharacterized membrane protein YraQ (UPF0718 family)
MKITEILFNKKKNFQISLVLLILLVILGIWTYWAAIEGNWSNFATVFLGIFIEAIPFLLMGTLASGFVEVFISPDIFQKIKPKSAVLSTLMGCFLGLVFPVCECGVVPVVRRLFKKGLPIPTGIAFLLAAPVINPIVIISTASAFGVGTMLWMRLGFTSLIAFITGLVFASAGSSAEVLQSSDFIECEIHTAHQHMHNQTDDHTDDYPPSLLSKLERLFLIALDEFFEMGRYLVIGALISAGMQTFISQSVLMEIGGGAVSSVLVMIALAILLSICSTVDSFIALGFLGSFTIPAVLAFLLYGPMVDIKGILMFTHVFKQRTVTYLLLIPLVLTLLISVSLNYFWV